MNRIVIVLTLLLTVGRGPARADDFALRDKTLVAWVTVGDLSSRGGSVLTLGEPGIFDAIVYGEIAPKRWMPGSDLFHRSQRDQSRWPQESAAPGELLQIAVTYRGGEVALYRDGAELARYKPAKAAPVFRRGCHAMFGWRCLGAPYPGFFKGTIDDARVYARALTTAELKKLRPNEKSGPAPWAWWDFERGAAEKTGRFPYAELAGGARVEKGRLRLDGVDDYLLADSVSLHQTRLHFRPKRGNFADPIPFYWKGRYHVFYLQGAIGKVPWQHLVTKDLVHWEELPTALVSDGAADGPDGEHMFTGCVVEHEGTFHLYYTGWNPRNPRGREFVMHATSRDLVRWTKHPGRAFGPDGEVYQKKQDSDFRDPFVFRNEDKKEWWMLLCTRDKGGRYVTGVYASADLVRWSPRRPLCGGYRLPPECPDLFRIGDIWYLIISPSENVTTYRTAKELGGPWSPAPGAPIDTPTLYAAKRQFDGKRHVLTGWQRDLAGARNGGDFQWGGTQSLAREMYAGAGGELLSRPAPEVRSAFAKPLDVRAEAVTGGRGGELTVAGAAKGPRARIEVPADYHLRLSVKLGPTGAFAVALRQQRREADHYRLDIDREKQVVTLAGPGMSYPRPVPLGETVTVECFVNGDTIECFVNDAHAFSCRAYDYREGALDLIARRGAVVVGEVEVRPRVERGR